MAPPRSELDLLDADAVRHALAGARPECVFHLAAHASVAQSWERAGRGHARQPHDDRERAGGDAPRGAGRRGRRDELGRDLRPARAPPRGGVGAAPAAEPLCGLEGGMRSPRGAVRGRTRAARDPDARVQPGRPGAVGQLRGGHGHAAGGRGRGARAAAWCARGTPTSRATTPTCATRCARTWPRSTCPRRPTTCAAGARPRSGRSSSTRVARLGSSSATRSIRPRVRAHDVAEVRGSPRMLAEASGWSPAIPLEQTVADALDYWRARL